MSIYMDNALETMFSTLSSVPTWASMIAGFAIVLAVIFIGVKAFGSKGQELGVFGFAMLTFIGIIISTMLGLFPYYILVLYLVIALVGIVIGKVTK